ncbi:hypothetical protein EDC01DRAFT_658419 [Geopyxis carbonaria]|nr:hypothetical protein EDC01DRAFT_658419 [Geopyxis carbonaria]
MESFNIATLLLTTIGLFFAGASAIQGVRILPNILLNIRKRKIKKPLVAFFHITTILQHLHINLTATSIIECRLS